MFFLHGTAHAKYLDRSEFFITGNPRLENLKQIPLPEKPVVMINANFTYGIYENWRERWINDVVSACNSVGIDYFISKHPRDKGDYSKYNVIDSNAFKIEEQIEKASVVITRFSQIVFEALLQGRIVIYYNPHNERKKSLTEGKYEEILYCEDKYELEKNIKKALATPNEGKENIEKFLKLHCGARSIDNSLIAVYAINFILSRL